MKDPFVFPFDTNFILRKKKAIKREFLLRQDLPEKKIAILGGSTTSEIKDILELFLLKEKIKPIFYESGFNRYYEDIMFDEPKLSQFKPDILYIHTTGVNINYPEGFIVDKEDIEDKIKNEFMKFKDLWTKIQEKYNCAVVQNNFELPYYRVLGNLDSSAISGKTYFLSRLNLEFAKYAQENKNFYINDINYLSSWLGLDKWHDRAHWYSYKYAISYEAIPLVCYNLANIIKSIYGQAKKCLVLDLDNILWGGVIGDVGMENIQIGRETPLAEAYAEFQRYIKELKERGVILAVCSKNDPEIARQGLAHPDSILKFDDFAVFKANWKRKDENIIDIAREINIGLDSLVFIDDNPAEREIVKANLQEVTVPDMGNNVEQYIGIIDGGKYFEPAAISFDDINRNSYYQGNLKRTSEERNFLNYGDFLKSLSMQAEIQGFVPLYLDRITQLINKTNQFNLTAKRYNYSEIERIAGGNNYITLYGKLVDKFGDNGVVSVIIASCDAASRLHIDLWLMSCRIIKRDMEYAMFDALVEKAKERGIKEIIGYYCKSEKNHIVSEYYPEIGFEVLFKDKNGDSSWKYVIPENYIPKNKFIQRLK